MTVSRSGIMVVTKLPRTSLRELISPMILDRILPVGRLSKKLKSSVWIWVYSSCLIVTRMLFVMSAMRYIRSLIPATISRFRTAAVRISRTRPDILPDVISLSMAYSMNRGFSRDTTTQKPMITRTNVIFFL